MLPILIDSPWLILYSYPLFMGLGWGIAYRLTRYLLFRHGSIQNMNLLFWGNFFAAFLGSKILFLIVSAGDNAQTYFESSNFWLGGGFVFYGGFILAALFTITLVKLKKINAGDLPLLTIPLAIGHATGRVGCLLAGCCFGTECIRPWSVWLHNANRHPVQIYESIGLYIIGALLFYLLKQGFRQRLVSTYLIGYGILRYTLELFRADVKRGIWIADLSTSQIVAIMMIVIGTYLFFKKTNQQPLPQ